VTGSERRGLIEEVSCRQWAAYRLLVYALTTDKIEPSMAMWGAFGLLERAGRFVDLLADRPLGKAA
jgi:hypothetical protein